MATLKSHFLTRGDETLDVQTARLDPLTVAGRPFRLLALEARAIAFMEAGQSDAAQEDLSNILLDPETQQGLSQRAQQLILLMGGELPEMPGLETSSDATQKSFWKVSACRSGPLTFKRPPNWLVQRKLKPVVKLKPAYQRRSNWVLHGQIPAGPIRMALPVIWPPIRHCLIL